MPQRKPLPSKPEKALRIGSLGWNLDNVAVHSRAGFAAVTDETVRLHFYRYVEFLQRQGYLLRQIATSAQGLRSESELRSDDLTGEGYRFVQYSWDRWIARIYRYADTPRENEYLSKWHKAFLGGRSK